MADDDSQVEPKTKGVWSIFVDFGRGASDGNAAVDS